MLCQYQYYYTGLSLRFQVARYMQSVGGAQLFVVSYMYEK